MAKFNRKSFIIQQLRRASYKYPPRNEALKLARVDRGLYACRTCADINRRESVVLDHIDPVVDPSKGFTNWDDYVNRMFPETEGFQCICRKCHEVKTKKENLSRKSKKV